MAYIARSDIEARFGSVNVEQWADLDNTRTATDIAARIAAGIAHADEAVNDALRGGMYTLPVADSSGTVPLAIVDIAAKLAAVWLYELRGVTDFHPETGQVVHRLFFHKEAARKMLLAIRHGSVELDAVKDDDTLAPEVIK